MWGLPVSAEGPGEVTRAWRPGHARSRRRDGDGIAEPLDGRSAFPPPQTWPGEIHQRSSGRRAETGRHSFRRSSRGRRLETAMGVWGTGLYSSDMAADMRAVIKSA